MRLRAPLRSLEVLGWSKAHHGSWKQRQTWGAFSIPRSSQLAPGSRAGVLPGDFQLLPPDPSTESPRQCWESFPKSLPRSPALLSPLAASPCLLAIRRAVLSSGPAVPERLGVWGRQMEGRSGGEGILQEECNNQKR